MTMLVTLKKKKKNFWVGFDLNYRDKIYLWENQLWFYQDQLKPLKKKEKQNHRVSDFCITERKFQTHPL